MYTVQTRNSRPRLRNLSPTRRGEVIPGKREGKKKKRFRRARGETGETEGEEKYTDPFKKRVKEPAARESLISQRYRLVASYNVGVLSCVVASNTKS